MFRTCKLGSTSLPSLNQNVGFSSRPMRSTVSGRTLPPAWPCNNIAGSGDINRAGYPPQVSFPLSLSKLTRRDVRARFSSTDTNKKLASTSPSSVPTAAQELVEYLNESWTSYHATATAARMLSAAGYIRLREQDEWKILPGGKYFLTRNMSCLLYTSPSPRDQRGSRMPSSA